MLKLDGSPMRKEIYIIWKYLPTKYYKGEKKAISPRRNPTGTIWNKGSKLTSSATGQIRKRVRVQWGGRVGTGLEVGLWWLVMNAGQETSLEASPQSPAAPAPDVGS